MSQIFHPSTNTISRVTLFGAIFVILAVALALNGINRSSYITEVGVPKQQPVPFSHKHHVSGIGIDCRYCHTSVEKSSFAGMPATATCMSCHVQIWTESSMLEPVQTSMRSGQSLQWTRVHDLPGYVYFNHSIHVNKGVGCETCHGRVDLMPLLWKANTLHMEWCLDCHRYPEQFLRPKDKILSFGYKPDEDQETLGARLVKEYKIPKEKLLDCSVCHR